MEVFGQRFGMSRTNIGRYESGEYEASISFCRKLSQLTGISMERLVGTVLLEEEIPPLPLGEGGEKFVAANEEASPENKEPEELVDMQHMAEAVRDLQLEMERLKGMLVGLDEESTKKVKLLEAIHLIIEHLEEGLDEKDYASERRAYLDRLAALISGKGV